MKVVAKLASLWRNPLGRTGAIVLFLWLFLAVFAYGFSADTSTWANSMNLAESAKPMQHRGADGVMHWLGTDRYGRDMTGRLLLG